MSQFVGKDHSPDKRITLVGSGTIRCIDTGSPDSDNREHGTILDGLNV